MSSWKVNSEVRDIEDGNYISRKSSAFLSYPSCSVFLQWSNFSDFRTQLCAGKSQFNPAFMSHKHWKSKSFIGFKKWKPNTNLTPLI